jgi:hypothetical protein
VLPQHDSKDSVGIISFYLRLKWDSIHQRAACVGDPKETGRIALFSGGIKGPTINTFAQDQKPVDLSYNKVYFYFF